MDPLGDHALACSRTGLLARLAKVVERAWVRVAPEAIGAEGQVVLQQWLAHTTATGVPTEDRRRLDLVVYGATANGGALCCDATLVSPLTRTGHPHPCTVEVDGAALKVAERRKHSTYPELARGGPQKMLVPAGTQQRRPRPPPSSPPTAHSASRRVLWVGATLVGSLVCRGPARRCKHSLGALVASRPSAGAGRRPPALDRVLDVAADEAPSRLPLRP